MYVLFNFILTAIFIDYTDREQFEIPSRMPKIIDIDSLNDFNLDNSIKANLSIGRGPSIMPGPGAAASLALP